MDPLYFFECINESIKYEKKKNVFTLYSFLNLKLQ